MRLWKRTVLWSSAALALSALPVCAQSQSPTEPPPLSAKCEAPNADIAAPAPLPRFAEKLEQHTPVRILAIGSSSTWGIGATSRQRTYPAQLQTILRAAIKGAQANIINRGVSGELAQATADRLRTEVALEKPDIVLWQVGTNDALAHVPPADFEKTVTATIEWLKNSDIDPVIVGLQYTRKLARDANYFAIQEALRRVATAQDVLFVRRYDAMQFLAKANQESDFMSGDDLHLNDLGYQCMAEHVARAVIVSLFLRKRALPKPATRQ